MLEWHLEDLYDREAPHRSKYIKFAYDLLEERLKLEDVNISHTKMPTYKEHIEFINSMPYKFHCVIVNSEHPEQCIGVVYNTFNNELGITIAKKFWRQGYAKAVLTKVINALPELTLYANINPKNLASFELFEGFGFKPCQVTMKLEPRVDFKSSVGAEFSRS